MNTENLIPLNQRTKDEQRAIQKAGGKKSGEVRRRRADVRKVAEQFLYMSADGRPLTDIEEIGSFAEAGAAGLTVLEKMVLLAVHDATNENSSPDARAKARGWLIEALGGYNHERDKEFDFFV